MWRGGFRGNNYADYGAAKGAIAMTFHRRDFLKTAAGASLAAGLGGWQAAAATVRSTSAKDAFEFADDRVPMNAANLCPMPAAISESVNRFSRELQRDMSTANRRRIEAMKEAARNSIAAQLGTSPDELAIVRNTSEANSIIVQGAQLAPGDEVLLWDQNHPSNSLAWDVRAAREGFSVRRFQVDTSAGSIDEVVAQFGRLPEVNTRLIAFTHISNVSGFRLPADEICAELKRRYPQIFIHVDGAQTWGVRDVNLHRMGCDSFSGSAHKWFMGPRETGLLYIAEQNLDAVAASVVSIPWGNDVEPSVVGARRYEALGQRDDAAIAALAETVAWHGALTPAAVEHRAMQIADRLREALLDLDVPFVSTNRPEFRSNVVILQAEGESRRALPQKIFEDSGVITAATGGLRMSPHIYNTVDHVERVAAAIARSRSMLGQA